MLEIQLPNRRCRTERQKQELEWERAAHQARKQVKEQMKNQPPCEAFSVMRKLTKHDFPKRTPKGSECVKSTPGLAVYRFSDGSILKFEEFKGRVFITASRNEE